MTRNMDHWFWLPRILVCVKCRKFRVKPKSSGMVRLVRILSRLFKKRGLTPEDECQCGAKLEEHGQPYEGFTTTCHHWVNLPEGGFDG